MRLPRGRAQREKNKDGILEPLVVRKPGKNGWRDRTWRPRKMFVPCGFLLSQVKMNFSVSVLYI